MVVPRAVVDYALQRRAVLVDLAAGRTSTTEVCDADPVLVRASRWHGDATGRDCPVCRKDVLWHVTWVYGDTLGALSGSARRSAELAELDRGHGPFRVFVVEVCRSCGWNHLDASFVLGALERAAGRTPYPAPRTARRGSSRGVPAAGGSRAT